MCGVLIVKLLFVFVVFVFLCVVCVLCCVLLLVECDGGCDFELMVFGLWMGCVCVC